MKKYLIILSVVIVSGCVTYEPPPPPPPPYAEVVAVAPYPGAVWTGGLWVWSRGYHRYLWRHGYWHR